MGSAGHSALLSVAQLEVRIARCSEKCHQELQPMQTTCPASKQSNNIRRIPDDCCVANLGADKAIEAGAPNQAARADAPDLAVGSPRAPDLAVHAP